MPTRPRWTPAVLIVLAGSAQALATGPVPASIELSSLNGTDGFVLNGIDAFDFSGYSVSSAGDVNGDGVHDLIIGARGADPNGQSGAGESYVVFGAPGLGAGGTIELSSLNGTSGFVLNGIDASDYSGFSVSSAGDVNGDGVDDLIIGAPGADPNGVASGESYVVFGRDTAMVGDFPATIELSSLNGADGFVLNGIDAIDFSGDPVTTAGDVNGDGLDDIIIGAYNGDPNMELSSGESYVVFGRDTAVVGDFPATVELSSLNGTNGFVLNGIDGGDRSGFSVSSAGDVNGDGFDDVVVGAYFADPNGQAFAGESYVVFGAPGIGAGGSIDLSTLNGTDGFVANGIDAFDRSGLSVSSAGDVNGDGVDDLVIGAYYADAGGSSTAGESYVVFGRLRNVWTSPVGGGFDTASNWLGAAVPAGGIVVINTAFGVTVTGPVRLLSIDTLTLGAAAGRTTLDLQPNSLVTIADPFTIPASAGLSGAGSLATASAFTNDGLIEPTNLTLIPSQPIINTGDVKLEVFARNTTPAGLTVFGALTNAATLQTTTGLTNDGTTSLAFTDATIRGPVTNNALVSISGASEALLTDDVSNPGSIVLTTDSSLVVLGSLSGAGVTGPGGGAGGTVFLEGGFNVLASLATGIATFGGDLELGPTSTTTIEIGGTNPGAGPGGHDQIATLANLNAGGTLVVNLINGYVPQPGDAYQVLSFASASGSFSITLDPALIAAGADTSTLLIDGTITIPPPICDGDIDADNDTDVFDFGILALAFGSSIGDPSFNPAADLNADNTINVLDFGIFVLDFGCPD